MKIISVKDVQKIAQKIISDSRENNIPEHELLILQIGFNKLVGKLYELVPETDEKNNSICCICGKGIFCENCAKNHDLNMFRELKIRKAGKATAHKTAEEIARFFAKS